MHIEEVCMTAYPNLGLHSAEGDYWKDSTRDTCLALY